MKPPSMLFPDGRTVSLIDWRGHIEHVTVPFRNSRASGGLKKDEQALITSILVLPTATGAVHGAEAVALGQIRFWYIEWQKTQFQAPVAGLMNRYHGLTKAAELLHRHRLLIDPETNLADWVEHGAFAGVLPQPIHMQESLPFEIEHTAPDGSRGDDLVVEIQALVKRNALGGSPESFFRWNG